MYGLEREGGFTRYLGGIVVASELEDMLHPNFVHVDGGLVFDEQGRPVVTNPSSPAAAPGYDPTTGKEEFINGFRRIVNELSVPDGVVEGTYIPEADYAAVDIQVQTFLKAHKITIMGKLLAVAAVSFPYRLRQEGRPLDIPPPYQHLIEPDEPYFNQSLEATGDPALDGFAVEALQAVYFDEETGKITARVGHTTNDPRVPAFPAMLEILAARGLIDQGPPTDPPEVIARRLAPAA